MGGFKHPARVPPAAVLLEHFWVSPDVCCSQDCGHGAGALCPCPACSRGRERSAQHPGAGRAGSVPYGAAYFSPSLTSTSRALFAAKCFSRAREDAFPALRLSRDGVAACSPRRRDAGQEPVPGSRRAWGSGIWSSRLVAAPCWWQHPVLPMERLGGHTQSPRRAPAPWESSSAPSCCGPKPPVVASGGIPGPPLSLLGGPFP